MPILLRTCLTLAAVGSFLGITALPSPSPFTNYELKERHAVPREWRKVGAAPTSSKIHLQIGLKQSNQGAIEQHLLEISDPDHERHGQYLSAQEVADIVRPSDTTIASVHDWLVRHGISDAIYSAAKDWVSIEVPVAKAEQLLQTTYSTYQHRDGHVVLRAPEWSLPDHLHEHIHVVQPTTSFLTPRMKLTPAREGLSTGEERAWRGQQVGKRAAGITPNVTAVCNVTYVTAECLRTVYGTIDYEPRAADKNSVAINNWLNQTSRRDDIKAYLQRFRPDATDAADEFEVVIINDGNDWQGPPNTTTRGGFIEGNQDAMFAIGISYPTPFTVFSTGGSPPFIPNNGSLDNDNEPYLDFLNYALAQEKLPLAISSSYADDEETVPRSYAERTCHGFAQLGVRGVTYLVASGDNGVGGNGTCFLNDGKDTPAFGTGFPTSCPWVTSVGGTANFNPETAADAYGSGTGFSNYFAQPQYQASTVNKYIKSLNGTYDGLYNKTGRAYPDIAAQGQHDVIVYAGKVRTVSGTSSSTPIAAGVLALVNDALLAEGKPPLGFINPWLYKKGYKAFNDITIGSSVGCDTAGFPAQVGWDAVTGFGTPNFKKLVQAALEKK